MHVDVRPLSSGDEAAVLAAWSLFDHAPDADATRRFLREPTHHLLIAYEGAGRPVGFVSGVEMTHPDKGAEMFLYELAVHPSARGRGVGWTLVEELAALARQSGCYGMWTLTDADNEAARATYSRAGARKFSSHLMPEWDFRDARSESV